MNTKAAELRPGTGRDGSTAFVQLTIGELVAEVRACLSRSSGVELAASTEAVPELCSQLTPRFFDQELYDRAAV